MIEKLATSVLAESGRTMHAYGARCDLRAAAASLPAFPGPQFLESQSTKLFSSQRYNPGIVFENYRHNPSQTYGPDGVYITPLVGTQVRYAPAAAMGNIWGYTYVGTRELTINDGLGAGQRRGTFAHETMHNIADLVGANKGLSRIEEENLTRSATTAQLGPAAAWMHPFGPVRE